MEAITFTANTKKLQHTKLPIPKIANPDDVLIKVAYSGVCGTDIHIIQVTRLQYPIQYGKPPAYTTTKISVLVASHIGAGNTGEFPCNEERTFTLGHEFSGIVVEVGANAENVFTKGDKVAVNPNDGCNRCEFCHSGRPHFCPTGGIRNTVGIFRDGGWAEYAVVPVYQVHKLPASITLEQAVLSEPVSCLAHGYDILSPVTVGQRILIVGAGIIGSLWVSVLHLQGHRNVTVSEPNPTRLNMLKKLETGYTLITPEQLKTNQLSDEDYLFDVIIDCSGFAPAIEHAVTLLQKGGKLCCFGVAPPHAEIKIRPFEVYMKELKILGVIINPFGFPKSLGLLEAMGDRYLDFGKLGIHTFALREYGKAIELLKKGQIAKAVFKL